MNELKFYQVSRKNQKECKELKRLMTAYNKEIDKNQNRKTRRKDLKKWIDSVIDIQGENGRHLELCIKKGKPIGFLYGKIDHSEHKGYVRPDWGYIMEFYVRPKYRRKGCGKEMCKRLENLFKADGAENIYLTADPVTGKPFWEAMGFINTGIKSSENGLDIYEKKIPPIDFDSSVLQSLTKKTAKDISDWAYEKPYDIYNFRGNPNGYLMNKKTWGTEQFCLADGDFVIAQIACQFEGDKLWVGWSLNPSLCGQGNGHLFVKKALNEIRKAKNYNGKIYLRVSAKNIRAIKAYEKAGFRYVETVQDEVPYTNNIDAFWIMETR